MPSPRIGTTIARDWMAEAWLQGEPPPGGVTPEIDTGTNPFFAMGAALFGELSKAYAAFHAVEMSKIEAKSQASAFSHRARMLELDKRAAAQQAESILHAGQAAIGDVTMAGGQQRAELAVRQAASGVEAGVGSAAEVMASEKLMQEIDVYRINLATVQQANAARRGVVALENEARFSRVSASNLRRSARSAFSEAQLFGGLSQGVTAAAGVYNYRRR